MIDHGRVDRRERWFVEGAAALRRTMTALCLADSMPKRELYGCPCCLQAYGRDALDARFLTDEHVPPRALGGEVLLLTCKTCNNKAGTDLDAHAQRREERYDLLAGRNPGRDLRAEVAVGDIVLRANLRDAGDAFVTTVVDKPAANDPKKIAEATALLEAWVLREVADDGRIGFRLAGNVSLIRARLSWVRAAYLAAFAAFGWRYAFQRSLARLRAQLVDPDADLLPPLALLDHGASPERRRLFIVREPAELRSLAVVLGRYTVFLPSLENPQPFEDLADRLSRFFGAPAPRPRLVRIEIPWPVEPMYALDRQ